MRSLFQNKGVGGGNAIYHSSFRHIQRDPVGCGCLHGTGHAQKPQTSPARRDSDEGQCNPSSITGAVKNPGASCAASTKDRDAWPASHRCLLNGKAPCWRGGQRERCSWEVRRQVGVQGALSVGCTHTLRMASRNPQVDTSLSAGHEPYWGLGQGAAQGRRRFLWTVGLTCAKAQRQKREMTACLELLATEARRAWSSRSSRQAGCGSPGTASLARL